MNNRDYSNRFQDNDRAEYHGHFPGFPEMHQHYRDYRAKEKEFVRILTEAEAMLAKMKELYQ